MVIQLTITGPTGESFHYHVNRRVQQQIPTYQLVSLMNCHHTSVGSRERGTERRLATAGIHIWCAAEWAKMGSCSRTGGSAIESNDLTSHLGGWVCNGLCITMYNQCYWKQFNFKSTWEDGFVMVYESLCITSILKPFTGWCFIHILHLSIPEIGMMIPNH